MSIKLYVVFDANSKKDGDCEIVNSFNSRINAASYATKLRRKHVAILAKSIFKSKYPIAYKKVYET